LAHSQWLTIEELPAYAPELDPCEECWNHTKYSDLADFIPDDLDHLENAVVASLRQLRGNTTLLCSFFAYAGLKL
jgi:hypothetical protein